MSNDGGPAFPAQHSIDGNWVKEPLPEYTGMSLRDWYAGMAMQGAMTQFPKNGGIGIAEIMATNCYHVADAMLAARSK